MKFIWKILCTLSLTGVWLMDICAPHAGLVLSEVRRGHWILWDWSYRCLWASSARAVVLSSAEPVLQPQVTYLSNETLSPEMELFIWDEQLAQLILACQDWDKASSKYTFMGYSSRLSLLYTLSCNFSVCCNIFFLVLLIRYLISIENSAIPTLSKDDFGDICIFSPT